MKAYLLAILKEFFRFFKAIKWWKRKRKHSTEVLERRTDEGYRKLTITRDAETHRENIPKTRESERKA